TPAACRRGSPRCPVVGPPRPGSSGGPGRPGTGGPRPATSSAPPRTTRSGRGRRRRPGATIGQVRRETSGSPLLGGAGEDPVGEVTLEGEEDHQRDGHGQERAGADHVQVGG